MTRLSSDEVADIFKCIHTNDVPPSNLSFKIVVVPSNGMKLSPPSYNFENGLYVLTKPKDKKSKKKRKEEKLVAAIDVDDTRIELDPRVPSNLRHMVFSEVLPETCPWSLSGPQFTRDNTSPLQQRYCYPKGDNCAAYSKGAALWTRYDKNGREELDFRILHVYHSEKRAKASGNSDEEKPLKRARNMPKRKQSVPPQAPPQAPPPPPMLPPLPPSPTLARPRSHSSTDNSLAMFDDIPLAFNSLPASPIKDKKVIYALLMNSDPSDSKVGKDTSETLSTFDPKFDFPGPEEISSNHKYQRQGYQSEYHQSDPKVRNASSTQYHAEPGNHIWHGQYSGQSQWSSYRSHQYHSHSTHSTHSIDRGGPYMDRRGHAHPHMPHEPYPLQQERKKDASSSSSATFMQTPNINEELKSIDSTLSLLLESDQVNKETNRSTLAKWAHKLIMKFGGNIKKESTGIDVEMTSI